ncbi:MAG: two component transcriptional regulator, winged helix family [Clostridia bacterium]|nr:two component transcriptional regulator, winged helix family [Clostridia bacterium]
MQKMKVLLIEDEARIREMIKDYLENEGFQVVEAENGTVGLEKFYEASYSIILLDVMLPGIDGWTVCREIRSSSEVPIIMLTARGEEYDKLFGFELGADDYLTKPFSPKELVARMRAVLKRGTGTIARNDKSIFEFEDLWINMESRKVTLNGVIVNMTPKEFDLLCFFINNPDKVFTREHLLNRVWGYEFGGDCRTVDTHIKMLRESLKQYRNIIVTVWGVGYKFEIGGTK